MMELEVKYLPKTRVICTKNGRLKENNTSNDAKGWQLHRGLKIPEALQGGLCIVGSVIFFFSPFLGLLNIYVSERSLGGESPDWASKSPASMAW
jgi:hypothetical protein